MEIEDLKKDISELSAVLRESMHPTWQRIRSLLQQEGLLIEPWLLLDYRPIEPFLERGFIFSGGKEELVQFEFNYPQLNPSEGKLKLIETVQFKDLNDEVLLARIEIASQM